MGKYIKIRREFLGVSQQELGKYLGITWQQIQKYENGINRVSASRLWDISLALNTSTSYFFQNVELTPNPTNYFEDPDTHKLINIYYQISNKKRRKLLLKMMNELSK